MTRRVTTIEPLRARAGHRLYPINAKSDCPVHAYCAYDGTEPDRCAMCHVSIDVGCEHNWAGMPGGSRPAGCRACGEIFSSNSAFDQHRRHFECRDPSESGLVLVQRGEYDIWAIPGSRPDVA